MPTLNVTPEKRLYLSIISEYNLQKSICELIDNAIDLWTKGKKSDLTIRINIEVARQIITIEDNAGGIQEKKLDLIISPGRTSNDIKDDVIGYFGVGSKRAVVALAQHITIHSRYGKGTTYSFTLDDDWINGDPEWLIPYDVSKKLLSPNSTFIELTKLREHITPEALKELVVQIGEIYPKFINEGVKILVNDNAVDAIAFDSDWAFPNEYPPKTLKVEILHDRRKISAEITAGMINHSGDPDNSYGVFFYCNDRLITRGLIDFQVGFTPGLIGNPHYNISLVRTIVCLKGQSRDMPWNSSKTGLDYKHPVFQALQKTIIELTKRYSKICRSLQGKWDEYIFPFQIGEIKEESIDNIGEIPRNFLPTPPKSQTKWHQRVQAKNAKVVKQKPWTAGLQDSLVAVDILTKIDLAQKNRISLILIDSTLEIAYKEYLVNEQGIGIGKFKTIAENRTEVQKEILKTITIPAASVKKIDHYYRLRCDLIHQRTTPNVSDKDVSEYRIIVQNLLTKMFGLKFNV
jgi:histidine kinase/DNA gyrase B/HSP90-like ATPase